MSEPTSSTPARYLPWLTGIAVLLVVGRIAERVIDRTELARQTAVAAMPVVATIKPLGSPGAEELVLPGSVQAYVEAPIYARTSGYLRSWQADIGARVRKGDVLAVLDTPEVDRQLEQAQADLATANANALLARTSNERWKDLLRTQSVSQQDADARAGDAAAKQAAADSARANVARLQDLESFRQVRAPFDGVVTQRNTDVGALINAGQSAGGALFRVADTHRLRIYVQVPEPFAPSTRAGVDAQIEFAGHPGVRHPAKIVRTANALDPALRTLQVELQLENADGALLPGAYAEVHFSLPGSAQTLRLPTNALIFRAGGLQVATLGPDAHVSLRNVVAGRDFGSSIEILSGITAADDVIVNPPDSLADGAKVRLAAAAPARQ